MRIMVGCKVPMPCPEMPQIAPRKGRIDRLRTEGNGCIGRFWRSLKEQFLWIQTWATLEGFNKALLEFRDASNQNWLIGRHGHRAPSVVPQDRLGQTQAA
jgi:hypothetical protein